MAGAGASDTESAHRTVFARRSELPEHGIKHGVDVIPSQLRNVEKGGGRDEIRS